jgi:hypothetical protein
MASNSSRAMVVPGLTVRPGWNGKDERQYSPDALQALYAPGPSAPPQPPSPHQLLADLLRKARSS